MLQVDQAERRGGRRGGERWSGSAATSAPTPAPRPAPPTSARCPARPAAGTAAGRSSTRSAREADSRTVRRGGKVEASRGLPLAPRHDRPVRVGPRRREPVVALRPRPRPPSGRRAGRPGLSRLTGSRPSPGRDARLGGGGRDDRRRRSDGRRRGFVAAAWSWSCSSWSLTRRRAAPGGLAPPQRPPRGRAAGSRPNGSPSRPSTAPRPGSPTTRLRGRDLGRSPPTELGGRDGGVGPDRGRRPSPATPDRRVVRVRADYPAAEARRARAVPRDHDRRPTEHRPRTQGRLAPMNRQTRPRPTALGLHADRAAGRDRDHRRPDRAAAARRPGGPRGRAAGPVRQQPDADRPRDQELRERPTRSSPPARSTRPGRSPTRPRAIITTGSARSCRSWSTRTSAIT